MPRLPSENDIARQVPQGTRGLVGYRGGQPEALMAEQSAKLANAASLMIVLSALELAIRRASFPSNRRADAYIRFVAARSSPSNTFVRAFNQPWDIG